MILPAPSDLCAFWGQRREQLLEMASLLKGSSQDKEKQMSSSKNIFIEPQISVHHKREQHRARCFCVSNGMYQKSAQSMNR